MAKWRKPLTKIQRQERDKRERARLNMMGLRQRPGTPPFEYRPVAEAAWKPLTRLIPDLSELLGSMVQKSIPWPRWRRRLFQRDQRRERPPEAR